MPIVAPMEALSVDALPKGGDWVYEPKWDGFRCIASRSKGKVSLISKSGKPLDRYFPDIVSLLAALKVRDFQLDGEVVIFTASGLSFSDLQLRLHPSASRIEKLARATPASFILFDLLSLKNKDVSRENFANRRAALEVFFASAKAPENLQLSPQTASLKAARTWLKTMRGTIDGIVAKDVREPYRQGERVMRKFKPVKTADCVVAGFRYAAKSKQVGSLLLGLYDENGLLHHVGFTSSIAAKDKPALTEKLEALKGPSAFTGKSPGGPSRWSTERTGDWQSLKARLVAEISYDHVSDDRFRHGTRLIRLRPDKKPSQCKMDQLEQ